MSRGLGLKNAARYLLDKSIYDAAAVSPKTLFYDNRPMQAMGKYAQGLDLGGGVNYHISSKHPNDMVQEFKRIGVHRKSLPDQFRQPLGVIRFDDIPVGDWDWKTPEHPFSQPDVDNVAEVVSRLNKRVESAPNEAYRVYLTPGGVRAMEVGQRMTPEIANQAQFFDQLGMDPTYAQFSMNPPRSFDKIYDDAPWGPHFSGRITSKGQRGADKDFVAFHLGDINASKANPEIITDIEKYHDKPIRRYLAHQGVQEPNKKSIANVLDKYLGNVEDDSFLEQVRRNTRGLY